MRDTTTMKRIDQYCDQAADRFSQALALGSRELFVLALKDSYCEGALSALRELTASEPKQHGGNRDELPARLVEGDRCGAGGVRDAVDSDHGLPVGAPVPVLVSDELGKMVGDE